MKYEVNDKLLLRNDLEVGKTYGFDRWNEGLIYFKGRFVTISEVRTNAYKIIEDGKLYNYTDEMIQCKFEPTLEWCTKYGQDLLYKNKNGYVHNYKELVTEYEVENNFDSKNGYYPIIEIIQPTIIWQESDGRYVEPVEKMTLEQICKELGRNIKIVKGE